MQNEKLENKLLNYFFTHSYFENITSMALKPVEILKVAKFNNQDTQNCCQAIIDSITAHVRSSR